MQYSFNSLLMCVNNLFIYVLLCFGNIGFPDIVFSIFVSLDQLVLRWGEANRRIVYVRFHTRWFLGVSVG